MQDYVVPDRHLRFVGHEDTQAAKAIGQAVTGGFLDPLISTVERGETEDGIKSLRRVDYCEQFMMTPDRQWDWVQTPDKDAKIMAARQFWEGFIALPVLERLMGDDKFRADFYRNGKIFPGPGGDLSNHPYGTMGLPKPVDMAYATRGIAVDRAKSVPPSD